MSRREQIRMSDTEVGAFLEQERTVICATVGRDGFPHLMPLWYVVRGEDVWSWTFAKSQKVRNLERDPRATLQVEAGEEYPELRGVMLKCDVVLHRGTERVAEFGAELFNRYRPGGPDQPAELDEDVRQMVLAQAPKRVALQFRTRSRATWDHRKLAAGVY
ncbi:MAG TPA: pyridoxamine 5'-phosphate oxidase family protein [Solirubrobacteraceae bacterium]|nr:pyridoxamine 5'-phosphate oxidase family protein [Solirubrobacteraceae bacterium]